MGFSWVIAGCDSGSDLEAVYVVMRAFGWVVSGQKPSPPQNGFVTCCVLTPLPYDPPKVGHRLLVRNVYVESRFVVDGSVDGDDEWHWCDSLTHAAGRN